MLRNTALAWLVGVTASMPWLPATASAEDQPEKLKVIASFSIIADFARNVGGESIDITTLVGPDGDAHVYEPKPADAAAVAGADVVLANGLQYEGFLQRLVEASGTQAPVIELTRGGEMLKGADEEQHHAGQFDPHAWQSLPNAEIYVRNIVDAFCRADADGCDNYKANGEAYAAKLEALDAEIRAAVASIPEDKRVIITSHDAFGYFQHEYGVKFLAPEGVSTSPRPLPRTLPRSSSRSGTTRLRRYSSRTSPIRAWSSRSPPKPASRSAARSIPTPCRGRPVPPQPISR